MSLKNDIKMVKDELSSEEKFFEKAVMTERFVKKYKKMMIASVVALVVFVAGSITYSSMEDARVADANALFLELQADANASATSIARLESLSPELHDVWLYSEAIVKQDITKLQELQKSKAAFVADLSSYEVAQSAADVKKLEAYAKNENAMYADLATLQAAVIFMNKQELEKAHKKLQTISVDSPLAQVATALMHYGVR